MLRKHKIALIVILFISSVFMLPSTYAQVSQKEGQGYRQATAAAKQDQIRNTVVNKGTESAVKVSGKPEKKLEGLRLKACQQKEDVIRVRSRNVIRHANLQVEVFDKIASRTSEFYLNKIVPRGKTISDYNDILKDIQTKRDVIIPLAKKAAQDAESFSCETEGPKTQLTQFKNDSKLVIEAIKSYKVAVRNLIVAVRILVVEPKQVDILSVTPVPTLTEAQ